MINNKIEIPLTQVRQIFGGIILFAFTFAFLPKVGATIVTVDKVEAIESYLKHGMKELKVPGLTIGIVENGEVAYLKSFGTKTLGGETISETTPFKLGSVSKTFTALAIMKLYEEAKLDIDRPVVDYIPWFQTQNKSLSDQMTIRHLLSHTSGFSTITGNRNQDSISTQRSAVESSIRELRDHQLRHKPGTQFEYSNANYQILGYLIQQISGKSYAQFVGDNIFRPLKMSDSFFQEEKRHLGKAAQGHLYWLGEPKELSDELGAVTSAQGGIYASSQDMLSYLKMMLSQQDSIISNKLKQEMFISSDKQKTFGYGLGWYFDQIQDFKINYHFGQSAGFETVLAFSNDLNLGWFIAVNSSTAFGDVDIVPFFGQIGPILNGKPARLYGVPLAQKILFWFILLIPALVVFFVWRLNSRTSKDSNYLNFKYWSWKQYLFRAFIPTVISFFVPWFLLVGLPSSYGAPLSAVKFFQPLVFWLALVSSISMLIWLMIRIGWVFKYSKKRTI